jgi:hypothetical protein
MPVAPSHIDYDALGTEDDILPTAQAREHALVYPESVPPSMELTSQGEFGGRVSSRLASHTSERLR